MGMAIALPRYTVEELETFPDDGNRYELLDGALLVTPLAAFDHQLVASRLHAALAVAVQTPGHGFVLGPGGVIRPPNTQLEPDILVIPSRFDPGAGWKNVTEHWLAVEILSPSSRIYDSEFKRAAYFALGVQEVWIVNLREKTVEIWRADRQVELATGRLEWRPPVLETSVVIDLNEVFAGID